ncbi:MAG: RagB/SusD family nutrient uptake outer membrane protein, partial [Bacteroidaceae bacterium]|nr:RagB/SusD family nutrient uptake outer membrane protein [Bacteroidaceae bacterium]
NNLKEINRGIVQLNAYDEIFENGNSYESIFELQFSSSDSRKNGSVNSMWGHYSSTHLVSTLSKQDGNDARYLFSAWGNIYDQNSLTDMFCLKWSRATISIQSGVGTDNPDMVARYGSSDYNHWIIYRLSDMLLNNAEARACLLNMGVTEYNGEKNKDVCQLILRMVNRRWWYDRKDGGEPQMNLNTSHKHDIDATENQNSQYIGHVMNTRAIEFVGEGKRWFDLVRFAERNSDSDDSAEGMLKMYNDVFNNINPQNLEVKRSRCENLWGLYSPIYYMECKAYRAGGSNINQNPVWNKSKYER